MSATAVESRLNARRAIPVDLPKERSMIPSSTPAFLEQGDAAVARLLASLNCMAQDDAVGEIVALTRDGASLVQRRLEPVHLMDGPSLFDRLTALNCELLLLDGGNTHGDRWKGVFHPTSRTYSFLPEGKEHGGEK